MSSLNISKYKNAAVRNLYTWEGGGGRCHIAMDYDQNYAVELSKTLIKLSNGQHTGYSVGLTHYRVDEKRTSIVYEQSRISL